MRKELEERYELNVQRVRRLVETYRQLAGSGPGRKPVETVDVLRSAVVFLHATLEDTLRTLLAHRWPFAIDPTLFGDIPFALGQKGRPTTVSLADLANHREKTVQEIFKASVAAHLERTSFNNVADLKTALTRSGIDATLVAAHASAIAAMMSRRHQIVHRADRHDVPGSGNHAGASLGVASVEAWIAAVDAVCKAIVARV